jgi:signal peptide peptidase SppA
MKGRYEHILGFALSHPWNVLPEMLTVIAGILAHRIADVDMDQATIEAALVNRKNLPQPRVGSVAVIPIYGTLSPRMNLLSEMSGGTSYQKIGAQIREAVADKTIRNIVLDIDSPGGSAAGNVELAAEILRARTKKPILAQAQFLMGSSAYQIGAAATEIVAAPSAHVGGIGTYTIHNDLSEALKSLGVKRTYISAGEGKVDGNETGPPSAEYLARADGLVNEAFDAFVGNVVKGRGHGTTTERVRKEWKAYVYGAEQAKSLGMIDTIATLDQTLTRLLTSAEADAADRQAAELLSTPIVATDQELQPRAAATSQERQADRQWQHAIERELLDLEF